MFLFGACFATALHLAVRTPSGTVGVVATILAAASAALALLC